MAENKSIETETSVNDFVNIYVYNKQKKAGGFRLIELMYEWPGFASKMYEPTIL